MSINDNQYQGPHADENGSFVVFWHDDSQGWYWSTGTSVANVNFDEAIGPYPSSFEAFAAAVNLDFSINH